jgi:hypothetical protein
MDKYVAFEELKRMSKNLSSTSYDDIFDLLKNGIKKIPLPLAKVKKGIHIDRVRPNKDKSLFKHIDELGYIKSQKIIDSYLTSYGRANLPHQVMFYGALETSAIDKQRLTAIAETSNLFRDNKDCIDGEYYTVSRWKTLKEFFVVEIVFSQYALKNSIDIQRSFENQKKILHDLNLEKNEIEFYLMFLIFISEEFSKKVTDPDQYKISSAYANLALLHQDVSGISYPSVQTDYFGENIVLIPKVVDKYLTPAVCSTQILYKYGANSFIANGENYCDKISNNKFIEWKENDKSLLTDIDEVYNHLKIKI